MALASTPMRLGDCGGDCPSGDDSDGDNICDNAEIPGCTRLAGLQLRRCTATDENGILFAYATDAGFDCDGNVLVVVPKDAPIRSELHL